MRALTWFLLLSLAWLPASGCRRGARALERDAGANLESESREHAPAPPPPHADSSSFDAARAALADASAVDVRAVFRTRSGPVAASTKIFLFAGSSMNANFAQEIVEQKQLWRDAGFEDDEIACYYVIPYQEEFDADREQFLALAPTLAECHAASVKLLREHLATTAKGPFVYLYVSAHGQRPISQRLAEAQPDAGDYQSLRRQAEYPILDDYHVLIEALPDGTASGGELLGAYRAGMDARDIYLTPAHLAGFLAQSYAHVPKFVVLQACYSGGFIRDRADHLSALAQLQKITILTAARHDRESFGCGSDNVRTYYGGVFNDTLARSLASPLRLDWRALGEAVSARVAELESGLDAPASLPDFHSDRAP